MMTTQILATLATVLLSAAPAMGADADPLGPHRWKSRVLVVAAPGEGDPRLIAQRETFAQASAGATERDLVIVEAVGDGPAATALRRRFGLPAQAFRALLVGKDGEAKMTEREPIPAAILFSTIDAMPMRRDEQRRR